MPACDIFISYREDDARDWPAWLTAEFDRTFGSGRSFFARRSIDTGVSWRRELEQAIAQCRLMLVLIGPQWAGLDANGHRRLDDPDDWVRREVGTALARRIEIRPVLLAPKSQPQAAELPAELSALAELQSLRLLADAWPEGLVKLQLAVARAVPFDAFEVATREVREVLRQPHVLRLAGRAGEDWRGRVVAISEQIGRLVARKQIHDQLHLLENDVLRPLLTVGSRDHLDEGQRIVIDVQRAVDRHLASGALGQSVNLGLKARLAWVARAMEAAVAEPAEERVQAVVAALKQVLSGSLTAVNQAIGMAAQELRLDELADFTPADAGTGDAAPTPPQGTELVPLRVALKCIRAELQWRVAEHNMLQSFDDALRTMCDRGVEGAPSEWFVVQACLQSLDAGDETATLAQALAGGRCENLRDVLPHMRRLNDLIQPGTASPVDVADAVRGAFSAAARKFNAADHDLKDWCERLDKLRGHLSDLALLAGEPR